MIRPNATVGEAIEVIVRCWKRLHLEAQGPAIDPSADTVSTGKPGTRAPRDYGSAAERVKARLVAVAQLAEAEIQTSLAGNIMPARGPHPVREATKRAILAEEGHDPVEVAFLFRVSERVVKDTRREAGRDQETGERLAAAQRPVTEPTSSTLRRIREGSL